MVKKVVSDIEMGTLTGSSTLGYSIGNKEVLHIPQSSRTGASPSDSFMSHSGHSNLIQNPLYIYILG